MKGSPDIAARAVISAMPYRDVTAAAEWLCRALGFEVHRITKGKSGRILYAELSFGDNIIAIGSILDPQFGKFLKHPKETGGLATQSCYLVVSDADAHYAQAKAADARIILDIGSDGDGGRCFACRDLEGHIWTIGTYSPRTDSRGNVRRSPRAANAQVGRPRSSYLISIGVVLAIAVVASVTVSGWLRIADQQRLSRSGHVAAANPANDAVDHATPDGDDRARELARKWSGNSSAKQAASAAQARLEQEQREEERRAASAAEARQAASAAQARLEQEQRDEERRLASAAEAQQAAMAAQERLEREQRDEERRLASAAEAQQAAMAAQERLEQEQRDEERRLASAAEARLDADRATREAAESSAIEATQELTREQGDTALAAHPYGINVARALQALASRESAQRDRDAAAWSSALRRNTKASFAEYLGAYPNGRHAQAARASIAKLERSEVRPAATMIGKAATETPRPGPPSSPSAFSGQRWPSADEPFVGADGQVQ